MADQKKFDIFGKDAIAIQAKEGFSLPVRFQGKWVRVTKDAPVSFVVADLPYEAKIEIKAALAAGQISEVALPAQASFPKTAKES